MKCLIVLAIFAVVRAQDCQCPGGYHPEENGKWCRMDKVYTKCNAPPQPPCRCPSNFKPVANSSYSYQCISENAKQNCTNADEVQNYIDKYMSHVFEVENHIDYVYCNCTSGMNYATEDINTRRYRARIHYCLNTRLPFRRIPCNLELPPPCMCNLDSEITQWAGNDYNLKCQKLFLKLQCENDEDRAAYYEKIMSTGCELHCDIAGDTIR